MDKANLIANCRDFKNNSIIYKKSDLIPFDPQKIILGDVEFEGFFLPFVFVGSQSLWNNGRTNDLTVVFSGAVKRGTPRPTFHRLSFVDQLRGSVLFIADPLLQVDENLELGWYIGRPEWQLLTKISDLINRCRLSISADNTYLYGSSAGGYAALSVARNMSGLRVVSINPQVFLRNWSPGAVELFSRSAFSLSRDSFLSEFPEIDEVCSGLNVTANNNLILICQNMTDSWLDGQVGLLQRDFPGLFENPHWRLETFDRPENHAAEKIEWVPKIFSVFDAWYDRSADGHLCP